MKAVHEETWVMTVVRSVQFCRCMALQGERWVGGGGGGRCSVGRGIIFTQFVQLHSYRLALAPTNTVQQQRKLSSGGQVPPHIPIGGILNGTAGSEPSWATRSPDIGKLDTCDTQRCSDVRIGAAGL